MCAFFFNREGNARRTDVVQRKFQNLCAVTEKECLNYLNIFVSGIM